MTKEEFHKHWALTYPGTVPISHFFKHDYPDRWFRIHSLPESKRYADNDNEWKILLTRQNGIITDLFRSGATVLLVTGEYILGDNRTIHSTDEKELFKPYTLTQLDNIDLYMLNAENYDDGAKYRPAFAEIIWKPNQHDNLLREIANDSAKAFFVSFDKNIIIAPYDGGVDFVLKDSWTKDYYKNKYKQWLSERADGL